MYRYWDLLYQQKVEIVSFLVQSVADCVKEEQGVDKITETPYSTICEVEIK